MSIDSEPTTAPPSELLVQHAADAVYAHTGRRTFFEYRETGLKEATDGRHRSQIMRATDVMEQTGWHYHVCDLQFVYVIKGWVDLEFEGGRTERVSAGDVLSIPSGTIHNELAVSTDFEALEVVSPAHMDTVPVDPPA